MSYSRFNQMPKINIMNLYNKIEEQEKTINQLKEIIELLLINQEYNIKDKKYTKAQTIRILANNLDIQRLRSFILPAYINEDGNKILLNHYDFSAEFISSDEKINELNIPKSFKYQSQLYITKSIGYSAFNSMSLTSITIPETVSEFNKYWCNDINEKIKISVSPLNRCFKSIDDKIIVGKSSKSNNNFDTIYFGQRDQAEITIPDSIKYLAPNCFQYSCLKKVNFSDQSQLIEIGTNSFSNTPIEEINIPLTVKTIGDSAFRWTQLKSLTITENVAELKSEWCWGIESGTKVFVSPLNPNFKMIDDKIIVGKSDKNNDDYDILYFGQRDLTEITIPDNIKYLASCCFLDCESLHQIKFGNQSQLIEIGDRSFQNTPIENIAIPPLVRKIGDCAFLECENLKMVTIYSNSRSFIIGESAFDGSPLEQIYEFEQLKKHKFFYIL